MPSFTVAFDYDFASAELADMQGTVGLSLEVSEPNGWKRSLPLEVESPIDGTHAHAEGTVAMVTVRRMIALLENATAVDRDAYWVDVVAEVRTQGQLGGHSYQGSFIPKMSFALDDFQLYLRAGDSPETSDDPTTTVEDGFLPYPSTEPATLTILGLKIPVATARAVSVFGLLLAVGAGAAVIAPYLVSRRRGEAARVLAEYDGLLVSVSEPPATSPGELIEVRAFSDPALLSERTGRMILHAESGADHHFYLQDGGTTYHVRLTDAEPSAQTGGES